MSTAMSYARLQVVATEQLSPRMRRITLGGDDLAHFTSVAPDQQVKLFLARDGGVPEIPEPRADGDVARWYQDYLAVPEARRPWMRSYTVRRHLAEQRRIQIDFALHGEHGGEGPGSRWAATVQPGAPVGVSGPALSHYRRVTEHRWRLFAGDETALPAIGAVLESMRAGERAVVVAEVADGAEEQRWETAADVAVRWVHRGEPGSGSPSLLAEALAATPLPDGPVFAWIAGEASMVRTVRRHLVDQRGIDKRAIAFTGYWRLHLTQDEEATAQDVADDAEQLAELATEPA